MVQEVKATMLVTMKRACVLIATIHQTVAPYSSNRRRGLATGIVVAGGGFGGLVISPATTAMFSSIGYGWTVRTIAFLHLGIIIPASVLFKARVESGRDRAKRLKREQQDRERNNSGFDEKQHTINASLNNESQTTLAPKKSRIDFSALKEKRFLILVCLAFFVANGYFNPYYYFPSESLECPGVSCAFLNLPCLSTF